MNNYDELPSLDDLEAAKAKQKDWYIWSEGYAANEGRFGAFTLNSYPIKAESFNEAVKKHIGSSVPEDRKLYVYDMENDYWTCWACRLFDNEKDARRTFG